jgi:hypothetical protein
LRDFTVDCFDLENVECSFQKMDSHLLLKAIEDAKKMMDDAKKMMDKAQAKYDEVEEAFTEEWKEMNPNGSKTDMLDYVETKLQSYSSSVERHSVAVKSCKEIYQKLVDTLTFKVPKLFKFQGKVAGSKSVKGIRESIYRFAQIHCGYYPTKEAFSYDGDDLYVDIVFEKKQLAINFQTEFEFLSTHFSDSRLWTESTVIPIDYYPVSKRIFLKHYSANELDTPSDSISSQKFTEYQPTEDIVVYQSLEKSEWLQFGSEGSHLIAKHICKKRKLTDLDQSENNRLALSRQLHGYVDGLSNGQRPVVKLNYVPSNEDIIDSRYRIVVGVEFMNQKVKAIVAPLLKDSSRQTENPLIMECDVFVRNKQEFIECLVFKSEETQKLWEELGFR